LKQCDAVQHRLGSLDIDDELSDLAATDALIQLLAIEQRQCSEQAFFGCEGAFTQAGVALRPQAGTHELHETNSGSRQDHDGDQHFEQDYPAFISQLALPSEHSLQRRSLARQEETVRGAWCVVRLCE